MTSGHIAPPFIGFIETTYDALLIFEAARRGAIPRITRRLNDPEKPMIHSGAVFLFDEHESGIKRWTDGIVWSPSRILGNFLVYREVNNRANNRKARRGRGSKGRSSNESNSPTRVQSPNSLLRNLSMDSQNAGSELFGNPMGTGALQHRNDTALLGLSRERERQLVGSLTSAYAFKQNGLIKRTISMTVGSFTQHLISYYLLEDVVNGKLRTPSSVPEFASLEISPDYLEAKHFRFPVQVEIGPDGIPRYKGEGRGKSPRAITSTPLFNNEMYQYAPAPLQPSPPMEQAPQQRRGPMPIPIPQGPTNTSYFGPGSAGSNGQAYFNPGSASSNGYWDQMSPISPQSQLGHSHAPSSRGTRPPSSSRSNRFDPMGGYQAVDQRRRVSVGQGENHVQYYANGNSNNQSYDVKPVQAANGVFHYPDYAHYGPSSQASGSGSTMIASPIHGQYPATPFTNWQQLPPSRPQETPRHAGISPPLNNNTSLQPPVREQPGSAGSRPSSGQEDQRVYHQQHPHSHQWPTSSPWVTAAPLGASGTGPGPYQPPPPGPSCGPSGQMPY